jgi:hypothetical protein
MDSQVNLILNAAKTAIDSPRECLAAVIRAGMVAQVYANCDECLLGEIFVLSTKSVLKNDIDLHGAACIGGR